MAELEATIEADNVICNEYEQMGLERLNKANRLINNSLKHVNVSELVMLYYEAAEYFNLNEQWQKAAETYLLAALYFHYVVAAESHLVPSMSDIYNNAASCYKHINIELYCQNITKAIDYYVKDGRFCIAAKYQKDLADVLAGIKDTAESDSERAHPRVVNAYKKAALLYNKENLSSNATNCHLKAAHHLALSGDYVEAAKIYEDVAIIHLSHKLLKYGSKISFFCACICHLAACDYAAAQDAILRFKLADNSFSNTRECKFLEKILLSINEKNCDDFTATVVEFDSIQTLDQWSNTMLLRIKQSFN